MINSVQKLRAYIEENGFQGYDPYDALNSAFLRLLTQHSRWSRIAVIQLLRRFPFNLRPLFGVQKGYNPKGVGLFLRSYIQLYAREGEETYLRQIEWLRRWLVENSCTDYSGHCWGYNFDWQSRAFFVPRGTPTIVNTAFVGHAFLDSYCLFRRQEDLAVARSACDFLLRDISRFEDKSGLCFGYTPLDRSRVHNANLLAASLLARTGKRTGERELLDVATKAFTWTAARQRADGAWYYGDARSQQWIDHFHTGFNLEALFQFAAVVEADRVGPALRKGFDFYVTHFFLPDGAPRYYHNRTFPIDIHSAGQALVTLTAFLDVDERADPVLNRVVKWTIARMQDQSGFFYFRKGRFLTTKIPYIRWGQAWMLRGLCTVLCGADWSGCGKDRESR